MKTSRLAKLSALILFVVVSISIAIIPTSASYYDDAITALDSMKEEYEIRLTEKDSIIENLNEEILYLQQQILYLQQQILEMEPEIEPEIETFRYTSDNYPYPMFHYDSGIVNQAQGDLIWIHNYSLPIRVESLVGEVNVGDYIMLDITDIDAEKYPVRAKASPADDSMRVSEIFTLQDGSTWIAIGDEEQKADDMSVIILNAFYGTFEHGAEKLKAGDIFTGYIGGDFSYDFSSAGDKAAFFVRFAEEDPYYYSMYGVIDGYTYNFRDNDLTLIVEGEPYPTYDTTLEDVENLKFGEILGCFEMHEDSLNLEKVYDLKDVYESGSRIAEKDKAIGFFLEDGTFYDFDSFEEEFEGYDFPTIKRIPEGGYYTCESSAITSRTNLHEGDIFFRDDNNELIIILEGFKAIKEEKFGYINKWEVNSDGQLIITIDGETYQTYGMFNCPPIAENTFVKYYLLEGKIQIDECFYGEKIIDMSEKINSFTIHSFYTNVGKYRYDEINVDYTVFSLFSDGNNYVFEVLPHLDDDVASPYNWFYIDDESRIAVFISSDLLEE